MSRTKYYVEVDAQGAECSGYEDRFHWVCYGTIIAEGDSLEECLASAQVDLVDQDGGEAAIVRADADWMQDAVLEKWCFAYLVEAACDQHEDGTVGVASCVRLFCEENDIPEALGQAALDKWITVEALAAGIPLSVIQGKTKLRDYFSEDYIDEQCGKAGEERLRQRHEESDAEAADREYRAEKDKEADELNEQNKVR